MADDPINELVEVIDLPPLPEPRAIRAGHSFPKVYARAYTADQVLQVQREAYEAGRAAGAEQNCRCSKKLQVVQVPVDAYLWLMGMGNDGFVEDRNGEFWWRGAFNERSGLDMMEVYLASKKARQESQ